MAKAGTLHVTLVSATLLPSTTQGGSEADPADSYATLICGKQQFTTRTAKDQGSLPTWNETHSFEIEDRHDSGLEDLVIEIFAARHELNELLGVAKLPLCKIIPANEETSLHSLSRPHEGECGQVKVTLKWESRVTTTTQSAAMYGVYEQIQPSAPMYPPATTQPSAPVYPYRASQESYYGQQRYGDTHTPADAAASALAGLALNKDKQLGNESHETSNQDGPVSASNFVHQYTEHQSSHPVYPPVPEKRESNSNQHSELSSYENDSGSYPPYSTQTSSPYPPQGLPYLASPIGGVVTGVPYDYTHPPSEVPSKFKESESVAQQYGLPATAYPESYHHIPPSPPAYPPAAGVELAEKKKEKASKQSFGTPYYSEPPVSQSETYGHNIHGYASNTGSQPYPGLSQYGAPLPGHSDTYPPAVPSYPPSADFSNKAQNTTHQESGSIPAQFGAASHAGAYPPEPNVAYPPAPSFPSSGQFEHAAPIAGYPGRVGAEQGKDKLKVGMNGPNQGSKEGETQEKGFHGHEYGYPPQPYYPPAGYPQYGYAPQNHADGYPSHPLGYPSHYTPPYGAPGYGGMYPQYGTVNPHFVPPTYHGHQMPYGVAPGHQLQHGHYNHHHGGHGGHGGHKGHKDAHGYGHHGYEGHKGGHGYGGHKGHGGYGYEYPPQYGHHGGHHSHHKH
ncbi:hypothetical protein MPTK1_3g02580 [Marchantia polymorpha subsp. ruderalis]|uniref:C2 domain-containing protein n=2 Tax=Marchantia polymorpha TaxID=3197 RepID=A0AAF6AWR3_MARPO|nr:hypothetical protein MARPO_0007s0247 [Marchantia polymorpha]BBN04197.1 hypothetical protein Mp_3g02580 [Marchantia polymorpha subsp. ruderalis]|eukprot:PTQ47884.1 hypothetical protein MARPO_0007s0247 [Marchantia polymorpha]